ncbi:MAG: hypothetical protein ACR2GX_07705 [Candidatus Dormibacteria bacterium]
MASRVFSDLIPYAVGAVAVVVAWAAGLAYLDVFTPGDVKAWRRLATLRGFAAPPGRLEKLASRSVYIRKLQDQLDLRRLLGIAGRDETPLGFLLSCFFFGLAGAAVSLVLLVLGRILSGDWPLPPSVAFVVGIVLFLLRLTGLRREARKRQDEAGRALSDMLMLVGIMTDGRGLQLEDSVRILSRCVDTESLETIVDRRGWQRLIREPYQSTIELYRMIGEEYQIPTFGKLADAAANANVGFSERDTFTRLAKSVYAQRLAEARMKGARAKILVTIPVAGMLIPLLVLLGAPTFASITQGLGGH